MKIFEGVKTDDEFLSLAKNFGVIRRHPAGEEIKSLHVLRHEDAKPRSLSGVYGEGEFPLHTDTAFWPRPAKYVLLRAVEGDMSRATTYFSFEALLDRVPVSWLTQSVWLCTAESHQYFTQINFKQDDGVGRRLDLNCMSPANDYARLVKEILTPKLGNRSGEISWSPGMVAVIPNWLFLHGRGSSDAPHKRRILQRIYVD